MTDVMQGVRILEVAEHTFVPAASAILADWGAEVIKIEHVTRGDAARGLGSTGIAGFSGKVAVLMEAWLISNFNLSSTTLKLIQLPFFPRLKLSVIVNIGLLPMTFLTLSKSLLLFLPI